MSGPQIPSADFAGRIRSFHHADFSPSELVHAKRKLSSTVSVCIPAYNEEDTVGVIVSAVVRNLVVQFPLVDEVIVLDDRSSDRTGDVAAAAGASVVRVKDVEPGILGPSGKGHALWRSLHVSSGDIVCWFDADVRGFGAEMVSGLIGPLLQVPALGFVKGFYARPTNGGDRGGGRVTELVARPLIASLFPELVEVRQPLAGATAARRDVLESLSFPAGWGVEFALLVDVARTFGVEAIAQTNLGELRHRTKPLDMLVPQAAAVMSVALARSGIVNPTVATMIPPESVRDSTQRILELPPVGDLGLMSAS